MPSFVPIWWSDFRSDHLVPDQRVLDAVDLHPKLRLKYVHGALVSGAKEATLVIQTPQMRGVALMQTRHVPNTVKSYTEASIGFKMRGEEEGDSDFETVFVSELEAQVEKFVGPWLDNRVDRPTPNLEKRGLVTPGQGGYEGTMWAKVELDKAGKPKNCDIFDDKRVVRTFLDLQNALKDQGAVMHALLEVQEAYFLPSKGCWGVNVCVRGIQYFPQKEVFKGYNFIEQ
jgi:hypothetical protein